MGGLCTVCNRSECKDLRGTRRPASGRLGPSKTHSLSRSLQLPIGAEKSDDQGNLTGNSVGNRWGRGGRVLLLCDGGGSRGGNPAGGAPRGGLCAYWAGRGTGAICSPRT